VDPILLEALRRKTGKEGKRFPGSLQIRFQREVRRRTQKRKPWGSPPSNRKKRKERPNKSPMSLGRKEDAAKGGKRGFGWF